MSEAYQPRACISIRAFCFASFGPLSLQRLNTFFFFSWLQASLAHPAVVENALHEAQYPDQFRNNFYKNPHIADALAKQSWFGDKEMPVFEREADKIPRDRIVKIFKNAGFVRRR